MRPALCLSGAVGVAVAGAGLTVIAPGAAPLGGPHPHAVQLTASPTDPYVDLITNTFANLGAIGVHWRDDPLPALVQLLVNWAGYLETTVSSVAATGQAFVDGLGNLPGQLQTLFDAVTTGDFEAAIAMAIIITLSANPAIALVDHLFGIPYDIAGNAVNAAMAALYAAQVPIGLAAVTSMQATFSEIGVTVQHFVEDLGAGDLAGALAQLVGAPAQILDATLNSDIPGLPGLLTALPDLSRTGFVDAIVNFLPQTVAAAIGTAGDSTTLGPAAADLPPLELSGAFG